MPIPLEKYYYGNVEERSFAWNEGGHTATSTTETFSWYFMATNQNGGYEEEEI